MIAAPAPNDHRHPAARPGPGDVRARSRRI